MTLLGDWQMRRLGRLLWLLLAWAAGLAIMPAPAAAHEGGGFHPEKLWDLLRMGLLVAVVVVSLVGVLWLYERKRSHPRR